MSGERRGGKIPGWIEFRGFVCGGGTVCQHSAVIPRTGIVSWCNVSWRRRLLVDTLHVILSAVGYCYSLQLERDAVTFTAWNSPLFVAKLSCVKVFTIECEFYWVPLKDENRNVNTTGCHVSVCLPFFLACVPYLLTPWSRVLLEKLTSKLCS